MMRTWAPFGVAVSLLAGCSENRYVSTFHLPHGGTCPTDQGCEAAVEEAPKFVTPDEDHPPPAEETVPAVVAAKPAPATCRLVAEVLASAEVSNYATPEERAAPIAKHEARCKQQGLTEAERTCLVQASDPASMAYCAPKLFPGAHIQLIDPRDCGKLVADVRAGMSGPKMTAPEARVWEAKMKVFSDSCTDDRWTMQLAECVRANSQPYEPLAYCVSVAPAALRLKITERMRLAIAAISKR